MAHPELNRTELVWSSIKRYVATRNHKFRLSDVEKLTKEKIAMITQREVKNFTSHALKEEDRYKKMGRVIEEEENEG